MRSPTCRVCPRTLITAALAVCTLVSLSACLGNEASMPAEKAFALSASALSGSDRYGVDGEISIYDHNGVVAEQSRYTGEVTGHGKLNLQWSGGRGRGIRTRVAGDPASYHPLQLLKAIKKGKAEVVYAGQPDPNGDLQFRVTLAEEAARSQIADSLRAEMKQLRTEMNGREWGPSERGQANRVLAEADRNLEAALSGLRVNTVCLWSADRRTWFPRQMTEQTELAYKWKGKPYREKRVSVTNFLPAGQSGTMVKNSSTNL
jgi:hypothetical protein